MSETAVLHANYMASKLKDVYQLPYDRTCMHEFVSQVNGRKTNMAFAHWISPSVLDYGYHAPTVYFMVVDEAIMIEPTETEPKSTLDEFIQIMRQIAEEAETNLNRQIGAHTTPPRRLDESRAARQPILRWQKTKESIKTPSSQRKGRLTTCAVVPTESGYPTLFEFV